MPSPNTNRPTANEGARVALLQDNCWKCQGPHYAMDFPNKTGGVLHNIQEYLTVEHMVSTLRIYETLDGRQADHQATIVKIEGKVSNTFISILIDPSAF